MGTYLLALDQGTTSSRAILFDCRQNIVAVAQKEFAQQYPRQGWVEHDAMEIWSSEYAVMMEVLAKADVPARDIAAIGITNQRETTVLWDRETGRPIYNAIVWQCRRTAGLVDDLLAQGLWGSYSKNYRVGARRLLFRHQDQMDPGSCGGCPGTGRRGEILFGTVDTWLALETDRRSGARHRCHQCLPYHALRYPQAVSGMKRCRGRWISHVPCCHGSAPPARCTAMPQLQGVQVPVAGIAGDQQAALFGQTCFTPGEAKNTYGTGCFLLMNTGHVPCESKNGLITTIAVGLGDEVQYALEGSVFVGGAVIQWLRDEMRFFTESQDAEYYAQKVPDTGGVYLVPAFTGLGAPYWDMYARGCIVGLTRGTRREHIIRAAQESIAYQVADLAESMEKDTGLPLSHLKADGGASRDRFLMQFQADILNRPVRRPVIRETTALGAAFLAGLAVGVWSDREAIKALWVCDQEFTPQMTDAQRQALLRDWHRAVGRSRGWAEE